MVEYASAPPSAFAFSYLDAALAALAEANRFLPRVKYLTAACFV